MATKKPEHFPAAILAHYDKLIATAAGVERKGATMPYTSVNGNMFSYLGKDGALNLRLPDELRETFIKKYKTGLTEAHGIVQKEYVVVPDKLLTNTKELQPYFLQSIAYVKSLKPKPTTRKSSAKKK